MSITSCDPRWISATRAGKLLGRGPESARRVLDLAGIPSQHLPGCKPRWLHDDVIRLAERSVRRPEPPDERTII